MTDQNFQSGKEAPLLILAPLHGTTGHLFRTLFFRHFGGFDLAVAPFITTVNSPGVARSHLRDVLPENNRGVRLIPQILGNDPEHCAVLARAFTDLGYDEINLNLGCPFVKVTRKRRGSGLLPFPDRIIKILDYLFTHTGARISIKTRLGLSQGGELAALLPRLDDFPLESITIHPRIAADMYGGTADPDAFEACAALTRHRVVYNGDVVSPREFTMLRQRFGGRVHAWMIGRGAVRNPFIGQQIKGIGKISDSDNLYRLRLFHDELYGEYGSLMHGPAALLGKMKDLWKFMGDLYPGSERTIRDICRAKSPAAYERFVSKLFDGCKESALKYTTV